MKMYKGRLNIKSNIINQSNFQGLIDENIFIETIFNKNLVDDYSGLELGGDYQFWNYFQFNKKEYTLNPKVYIEYFDYIYAFLKIDYTFESYSNEIEIELETLFGNDKIAFLTNMLNNELKDIQYIEEYKIFKKYNAENNPFEWYKYLYENYYEDELLMSNIFNFLTEPSFEDEKNNRVIYNVIIPFKYIFKIQSDIELLKNHDLIKKNYDTDKYKTELYNHIFKNKNYTKFLFVIEDFEGKKNTAFYSQLFKYFQENNWLNIETEDSKEFRNFIVSKGLLEKFSKIQQKTSFKTRSRWDTMFDVFDNILLNYSETTE